MPNDIVRSVSGFFNRSRRERKSGRQNHQHQKHVGETSSNTFVRATNPVDQLRHHHRPPVHFNDDYVDPLDMIATTTTISSNAGRYDEPWEASNGSSTTTTTTSTTRQATYDAPWGEKGAGALVPGLNYDEPWDAIGSTNGTISSETGKTSSSSGSKNGSDASFRPDPRLIVDPFGGSGSGVEPHRRSRSLVPPPPSNVRHRTATPTVEPVRPAKSYESINPSTTTPGVLESPLKWQERNTGADISESQYLKQMLRQSPCVEAEDLLYGSKHRQHHHHQPQRNVYDSPWSDSGRVQVAETIPVNQLYKLYDLNNSMSSQSTQSSSDHQHNQSHVVIQLDQMDYYRAGMTRAEAEKILTGEEIGAFVVRRNTQNPSWFSLSVVTVEQGVLHLVISDETGKGWHIGGFSPYSADFGSIPELIAHYQGHSLNIKGTRGLLLHSTTK